MPSLLDRLRSRFAEGKSLSGLLKFDEKRSLSLVDADDLCEFLAEQSDIAPLLAGGNEYDTPFYHLVMPFQSPGSDDARDRLAEKGLPELLRLSELALEHPKAGHALAMATKMFALNGYSPALDVIAAIVRRFPDGYWISVAFNTFGDERHPDGPSLIDRLRDPLPTGFARVLTLDLANALSRQNRLPDHPFDTPAGHQHLEAWLADRDPGQFSYAVSTAASLPFLKNDEVRNRLAALAFDHLDPGVQMEAAWATAFRGSDSGLKVLARMSLDVGTSIHARRYLEELGRSDAIPDAALDPNFEATAHMCDWLKHPSEFGEPPTEIAVYDTRRLAWPPTNDTRPVWLLRYRYAPNEHREKEDIGIGMVGGSSTFALFGESTADMSPEEIYALHCCWELEMNGDPRAPKKRSVEAGRKLLGI